MALPAERTQTASGRPPILTARAVFLGMATGAFLNIYSDYTGMILGSASLVKSQLPMAMLLPFVAWLGINLVLRVSLPRFALSSSELLVIYSMSWVVGTVSASGWTTYWGGIVSSPMYYASPENRWEEMLFDVMPWWSLPQGSMEVIRTFYEGLPEGASIPWEGWVASLYWWFTISLALVVAGLCVSILFQKQWEEAERLTFPLAVFPVALTEGFDGESRIPAIFKDRVFLAGFMVVFGIFAWNMFGYWMRELPRIPIFDHYLTKEVKLARMFPSIYLRVLPPVIGLTYLCNLDVLMSFWAFRLFAILKEGVMARVGFAVGYTGQQAEAGEILTLESHGALVFLAIWSIWTARGHLGRIWQAVRKGVRTEGDDGVIPYRYALLCLAAATLYVLGCLVALGLSFVQAILHLGLMYVAYFTVTKYTAASGFSYLFPVGAKGGGILKSLMGTAELTRQQFVGLGLINSSVFFGNSRIPAWPSLPHHLRLFGGVQKGRQWVFWAVLLAFASGFLGSCLFIIYLGYEHAGQNLGLSGFSVSNRAVYNGMVAEIVGSAKTVFDPAKVSVWVLGGLIATVLMQMYNRIPWWPLHPMGLAFQTQSGSRVYAFSMFLTWSAKHIILRIGGISLYERARPFFFGLVIGYVVGIGCSSFVDMIWFPGEGHWVHGW